jgi:hypothetical protein
VSSHDFVSDDYQIGFPLPCMLFPVIVRRGADGRRAYRGHTVLKAVPQRT